LRLGFKLFSGTKAPALKPFFIFRFYHPDNSLLIQTQIGVEQFAYFKRYQSDDDITRIERNGNTPVAIITPDGMGNARL